MTDTAMEDGLNMKPLPEAIRDLQAIRSMSRTGLWVAADVSPSVLSRYLKTDRRRIMNPQAMKTVEKIARALGVAPEHFLEYRVEKGRRLVEEGIRRGEIDLEDIELVIERHKFMKGKGS